MRALKFVLTGLLLAFAVIGGLFTVALVALTTIAVFLFERFGHGPALSQPPSDRARGLSSPSGDAIDVSVTEMDPER